MQAFVQVTFAIECMHFDGIHSGPITITSCACGISAPLVHVAFVTGCDLCLCIYFKATDVNTCTA